MDNEEILKSIVDKLESNSHLYKFDFSNNNNYPVTVIDNDKYSLSADEVISRGPSDRELSDFVQQYGKDLRIRNIISKESYYAFKGQCRKNITEAIAFLTNKDSSFPKKYESFKGTKVSHIIGTIAFKTSVKSEVIDIYTKEVDNITKVNYIKGENKDE